jgi:para-aminobenzoate synthetase component I
MFGRDYQFWMGGRHATKMQKYTDDPSALDDGGFWAVLVTFEGQYHFAKFKNVQEAHFPNHLGVFWRGLGEHLCKSLIT